MANITLPAGSFLFTGTTTSIASSASVNFATTQWIQYEYDGSIKRGELDIVNRLDRAINQIQLVLDRKDTVLL